MYAGATPRLKILGAVVQKRNFCVFLTNFSGCQNHCQVDCGFSAFVELALEIRLYFC